jgi:hypothetical protein
MEAQIVRLRDALAAHYTTERNLRIWRGLLFFLYWISSLMLGSIWLCSHYLEVGLGLSISTPRKLLMIFLALSAIWAFLSFCLIWSSQNVKEKIEVTREELSQNIAAYEELCNVPDVREILIKNGYSEDYIHPISISMSDFGAETMAKARNSILWRIWDWIVGDGPDYRYALICPKCHKHNGMVDESCLPRMKYRCEGCQSFVSATEVLPEEQRTSQVRTMASFADRARLLDEGAYDEISD